MAAVGLFKGRRLVSPGGPPDLDFFKVSWRLITSTDLPGMPHYSNVIAMTNDT